MALPLDDTLVNRAAPPGSMRYFALLYAPPEVRTAVTALFIIDAEIRESAQSINHDVAHTRLQWWRTEIDRLVNGDPQHPAARALNQESVAQESIVKRAEFARLHELVVAADMDLARMTYVNTAELRAYASRSGGAIAELIAATLEAQADASSRAVANRLGLAIRLTEIVRDARADAYGGRLYVPLDALDRHGAKLEDFAAKEYRPPVRAALRAVYDIAMSEFDAAMADISRPARAYLRPLIVLGALHRQLLKRMAARDFDVAGERIDLGPVAKPWIAWRAARGAGF